MRRKYVILSCTVDSFLNLFTMQCLDCQLLAGQQHEFLEQQLTVELYYKPLVEQVELSLTGEIPYLKVSGFSAMQGIEKLLKEYFCNKLSSKMSHGNINVVLTSTDVATVEFENHEGEKYMSYVIVSLHYSHFRLPLLS